MYICVMKKCTKCLTEKPFSGFHKGKNNPGGYKSNCKACILGHEPHEKPLIEKTCTCCRQLKRMDLFPFVNRGKLLYHSQCRACKNKKKSERNKLSPEKERSRRLKLDYGITMEKYISMKEDQKFRCLICNRLEEDIKKSLAVDHCHVTKKVRGLLCFNCNVGLGYFKDNKDLLLKAAEYLNV